MEVKIGVLHTPKELTVELDGSPADIAKLFDDALRQDSPVVWLHDNRGRRVGIPIDKVAYVEIETDGTGVRVGFGR